MKKAVIFSALSFILIFSCKKENHKDAGTPLAINNPKNLPVPKYTVSGIDTEQGAGKVIFSQNGVILFYFDNFSQEGKIKINQQIYSLSECVFSENNYIFSGEGIKITAEDGDFENRGDHCLYGLFSSIKISVNNDTFELPNANSVDCPNY